LDEVFGEGSFISQITFQKTSGFETATIATLGDYLLWYARDPTRLKLRKLYEQREIRPGEGNAAWALFPDGAFRGVTAAERRGEATIPDGAKLYFPDNLISQGAASMPQPFVFQGKSYEPNSDSHWKANYPLGMQRLAEAGRLHVAANSLRYRRFADDFPLKERGNIWTDTLTESAP
jgi:adenine-specific DNA-methyltransferase